MFAFFKLGAYKSIKLVDQVYNLLSPDEIKIAQEKCHVVSYDILNNVETSQVKIEDRRSKIEDRRSKIFKWE